MNTFRPWILGIIGGLGFGFALGLTLGRAYPAEPPTMYYWSATWCAPCRVVSPMVQDWLTEHPEVRFVRKDYDRDRAERERLNLSGVPVLVFVYKGNTWKYGEFAKKTQDFYPERIDEWLSLVYP